MALMRGSPCLLATCLVILSPAGAALDPHEPETCHEANARLAAENARLVLQLRAAQLAEESSAPDHRLEKFLSPGFIKNSLLAFVCVVCAALAAGLTMGMVSLEPMEMEIIVNSEEKDHAAETDRRKLKADQAAATRILPLIQDHHRLLVTLLLLNSIANEALPLFLDKLVPSWLAVVLSVTLVLMFGEIIPSAVFTGSEQLRIASWFAPMVSFVRVLLAPVAWPIAKILDFLLGEDHKGRYNFAELRAIVGIHARLHTGEPAPIPYKCHDDEGLGVITTETPHSFSENTIVTFTGVSKRLVSDGTPYYVKPCAPLKGRDSRSTFKLYTSEGRHPADLVQLQPGDVESGYFSIQERDELKIMHGVMLLTHMTAKDAMVPLKNAWMLEGSRRLTQPVLQEILDSGYSRIPVYSVHKHNLRGFVLVKKLIVVSPEDEQGKGRCVESLGLDPLVVVPPSIPMLDLLNKFQESRCHLALITNSPDDVTEAWQSNSVIPPDVHMAGIITLEDVIEKLLQEDIEDEDDARKQATPMSKKDRSDSGRFRLSRGMASPVTTLEEPLLSSVSPCIV